jgi:hypothetical protein
MALVITATPATFDRPGPNAVMTMLLLDPNRIVATHQPGAVTTLDAARKVFEEAIAGLDPAYSYCVSASWAGRVKPPRGFLAAWRRNEFTRKLNRLQAEAA